MASIGGLSCTFIRGEVPPMKMRTRSWSTPGINGYGAQKLGLGDAEFELTGIYYGATRAAVDIWLAAIAGLQGTVVTVVDDWGNSRTGCLLVKIGTPKVDYCEGPSIKARAEVAIKGVHTA